MKTLKYILSIILGLLLLIFIEGMMTLGQAFNFEQYNWFGYFIQALLMGATIIICIFITHEELSKTK
jgi:hypothetical protein